MLCSGLLACCLTCAAVPVSLDPQSDAVGRAIPRDAPLIQLDTLKADPPKVQDLCATLHSLRTDTGESPVQVLNEVLGETACPNT